MRLRQKTVCSSSTSSVGLGFVGFILYVVEAAIMLLVFLSFLILFFLSGLCCVVLFCALRSGKTVCFDARG